MSDQQISNYLREFNKLPVTTSRQPPEMAEPPNCGPFPMFQKASGKKIEVKTKNLEAAQNLLIEVNREMDKQGLQSPEMEAVGKLIAEPPKCGPFAMFQKASGEVKTKNLEVAQNLLIEIDQEMENQPPEMETEKSTDQRKTAASNIEELLNDYEFDSDF